MKIKSKKLFQYHWICKVGRVENNSTENKFYNDYSFFLLKVKLLKLISCGYLIRFKMLLKKLSNINKS